MVSPTLISFLSSTLSTVLGGVVLAILFFWSREKWFPLPNISGCWYLEMRTVDTAYNPYKGMVLRYVAMLWREGTTIKGTAEKVYEHSSTGEHPYIGKHRTRSSIEGHIEKRYLSKDQISLHIVEDGHGRESTHFHALQFDKSGRMTGTFSAMVADSGGEVVWQRQPF